MILRSLELWTGTLLHFHDNEEISKSGCEHAFLPLPRYFSPLIDPYIISTILDIEEGGDKYSNSVHHGSRRKN